MSVSRLPVAREWADCPQVVKLSSRFPGDFSEEHRIQVRDYEVAANYRRIEKWGQYSILYVTRTITHLILINSLLVDFKLLSFRLQPHKFGSKLVLAISRARRWSHILNWSFPIVRDTIIIWIRTRWRWSWWSCRLDWLRLRSSWTGSE